MQSLGLQFLQKIFEIVGVLRPIPTWLSASFFSTWSIVETFGKNLDFQAAEESTLLHSRCRCRWTEGRNLLDVHCTLLWFDVDTSKYIWAESSIWSKSNAHGLTVSEPHIISFEVHTILINFFSPPENLVFSQCSFVLLNPPFWFQFCYAQKQHQ